MLSSEHNGQRCGAGETGVGGRGRVQSHLACLAVFTADSACCQTTPAGRLPNQKPATWRATARQTKVQALTARLVPVCQKKETSQRIYKVRRKPGISIMTFYQEVSGLHGERIEEKLPERSNGKPPNQQKQWAVQSLRSGSWATHLPVQTPHFRHQAFGVVTCSRSYSKVEAE